MSDNIGGRAKRLRKARGFTQNKLAYAAEVDPSTISRLELGVRTPDTSTLRRIATALGVPFAELAGNEGEQPEASGAMYPSLRAFLDAQGDVSPDELTWLCSQRFAEHVGDAGSALWWYSQLRGYRSLQQGLETSRGMPPGHGPGGPQAKHHS